jgi:hypothetical protein
VTSYKITWAENNGVPTHIASYKVDIARSNGTTVPLLSTDPTVDIHLLVPAHGTGSMSPPDQYLGLRSSDATGTLILTMKYVDENGATRTAMTTAPVVVQ